MPCVLILLITPSLPDDETRRGRSFCVLCQSFQHRDPHGVHFCRWSAPQVHADSTNLLSEGSPCLDIFHRLVALSLLRGSCGPHGAPSPVCMSATRRLLVLNGLFRRVSHCRVLASPEQIKLSIIVPDAALLRPRVSNSWHMHNLHNSTYITT